MQTNRNYGIDLIKIVSMIMIVLLHVLGQGGILSNSIPGTLNYSFVWLLEISSYCAVNCYGMISGYLYKPDTKKIIRIDKPFGLWLQIAFYTISITAIFDVFNITEVTKSDWRIAFTPIMHAQYWYMTAYFGLYILMPVLNIIIDNISKKDAIRVFTMFITLCSILPTVFNEDPFIFREGYSMLWLCILYVTGGLIRKFNIAEKYSRKSLLLIYLLMIAIMWVVKLQHTMKWSGYLLNYTSPTMIFAAISLVLLFSKIAITGDHAKKTVTWFSTTTLGVYLIHVNQMVFINIIGGMSEKWAHDSLFILIMKIVIAVGIIYIAASLTEYLRIVLFKKLKVKKLIGKVGALW